MVPQRYPNGGENEDAPPSTRVVRSVAVYSNEPTENLPPLRDSIDPDALDAVTESMADGYVAFTYANHRVTVTAEGDVSTDRIGSDDR